MLLQHFKESKPFIQLVFFILIAFISFFLIIFFGFSVSILLFGKESFFSGISVNEIKISYLRYMQGLSQTGLFLIPPFIFAKVFYDSPANYFALQIKKKYNRINILFILLFIVSFPLVEGLSLLNQSFAFPESMKVLELHLKEVAEKNEMILLRMLSEKSFSGFIGNLLIIGILPAFAEEFFFRGVLQQLVVKWTKKQHLSVILTAVIFSAVHFNFFYFLPRIFLGMILGYAFLYSKTLWIPILIHFINNASNILVYYFSDSTAPVDTSYLGRSPVLILLSLGAFIFIAFCLRKLLKNKPLTQ